MDHTCSKKSTIQHFNVLNSLKKQTITKSPSNDEFNINTLKKLTVITKLKMRPTSVPRTQTVSLQINGKIYIYMYLLIV